MGKQRERERKPSFICLLIPWLGKAETRSRGLSLHRKGWRPKDLICLHSPSSRKLNQDSNPRHPGVGPGNPEWPPNAAPDTAHPLASKNQVRGPCFSHPSGTAWLSPCTSGYLLFSLPPFSPTKGTHTNTLASENCREQKRCVRSPVRICELNWHKIKPRKDDTHKRRHTAVWDHSTLLQSKWPYTRIQFSCYTIYPSEVYSSHLHHNQARHIFGHSMGNPVAFSSHCSTCFSPPPSS